VIDPVISKQEDWDRESQHDMLDTIAPEDERLVEQGIVK